MRRAAGGLVALAILTGCVGPATTVAAYRGKAVHAADAAASAVATATLGTGQLLAGRLFQAYAETLISGSEEALSSVQGQFDSIEPPDDPAADRLRARLDTLLSSALGDLTDLRIAVRRDDTAGLRAGARKLTRSADALTRFGQEYSS